MELVHWGDGLATKNEDSYNMVSRMNSRLAVIPSKFPVAEFSLKFSFAIVLAFLLLASVSDAAVEDFEAYVSSASINACSCTSANSSLVITNTGDFDSTYHLSATGTADHDVVWTFAPNGFMLRPRESATVTQYIRLPCGFTGSMPNNVVITTKFGLSKQIAGKVSASNCQNIHVSIANKSQSACNCESKRAYFNVKNIGPYVETYDISVLPNANELSENLLILRPGESKIVWADVAAVCLDGSTGSENKHTNNFTFEAKARTSKFTARAGFTISTWECYGYKITTSRQSLGACSRMNSSALIDIKNDGTETNSFRAVIDGPLWISLNSSALIIPAGESRKLEVSFAPPHNTLGQIVSYNINISPEKGGPSQSESYTINVSECFGVDILEDDLLTQSRICCGLNDLTFPIKNTGRMNATVIVEHSGVQGPARKEYWIAQGAKDLAHVYVDAPCDFGIYTLDIKAMIMGHEQIFDSKRVKLEVLNKKGCYNLQALQKKAVIYAGNETTIQYPLKNSGARNARYYVSLEDVPAWVSLRTHTLNLNVSQTGIVEITAWPNASIPTDRYLAELRFDVIDDNATYTIPFSIKVKKRLDLLKMGFDFVQSYLNYILLFLLLIVIIWVINKLYNTYHEAKLTRKIIEQQEKMRERENYISMTARERRAQRARIAREAKKSQLTEPTGDARFIKFVRLAGICIVIVLALMFFFANFRLEKREAVSNTTIVEDISTMLGDLKGLVIKPFDIVASPGYNDTRNLSNSTEFESNSTNFNHTVLAQNTNNLTALADSPSELRHESFTYHILSPGQLKSINLSRYFFDPDADELSFSAQHTTGIGVTFDGDVMVIIAHDNATKHEKLIVTATDPDGQSISSPQITIDARK